MTAPPDALEAVHAYCSQHRPGPDDPVMGDARWCRLSDDDPAKLAAVVAAGWHFWSAEEDLALPCWPGRLAELVDARVDEELRRLSHDVAGGTDWRREVAHLSTARLARRARQAQHQGRGA